MFRKGDKIVYPMYGAGVIEALEQKEVDGSNQTYYVLNIPVGNLKIMISSKKAENLGIRRVCNKELIFEILKSSLKTSHNMPENWNERYKENMQRIKTGNLSEAAFVFRHLMDRERKKGLSSAEKKMLMSAKQIIVSEIILSQDVDKPKAEKMLLEVLDCEVV